MITWKFEGRGVARGAGIAYARGTISIIPARKKRKEETVHIKQLFIYPVKSCAGIEVKEVPLGATGPRFDRMFVVVNEAGEALTQVEHPRLCLVQIRFTGDHVAIQIPGAGKYYTPLWWSEETPPGWSEGEGCKITILGDSCRGIGEGDRAAKMFSDFLGEPCRLVRQVAAYPRIRQSQSLGTSVQLAFTHTRPLNIVAEASLDDLNRRLDEPVTMDCFRPNIIIGDAWPYAEDGWKMIAVNRVVMRDGGPCTRCATVAVDQATGITSHEPLRTLAGYRRNPRREVAFGRNFLHINRGVLRVGDALTTS